MEWRGKQILAEGIWTVFDNENRNARGNAEMNGEEEKRDNLKELLDQSEYYIRRRKEALDGKDADGFIKELESFAAGLWRSLYEANEELARLKENLGTTEDKKEKLEELLLQQLFDSVTDGVTN